MKKHPSKPSTIYFTRLTHSPGYINASGTPKITYDYVVDNNGLHPTQPNDPDLHEVTLTRERLRYTREEPWKPTPTGGKDYSFNTLTINANMKIPASYRETAQAIIDGEVPTLNLLYPGMPTGSGFSWSRNGNGYYLFSLRLQFEEMSTSGDETAVLTIRIQPDNEEYTATTLQVTFTGLASKQSIYLEG